MSKLAELSACVTVSVRKRHGLLLQSSTVNQFIIHHITDCSDYTHLNLSFASISMKGSSQIANPPPPAFLLRPLNSPHNTPLGD